MSDREETIADLDLPEDAAERVQGGIVTDNKDPDKLRSGNVIESLGQKY
jgi:hypothetical protein